MRRARLSVMRLSGALQHQSDGRRQPVPRGELALELLTTFAGQGIKFCRATEIGGFPRGNDPPLVLEPMQRRIERPLLNGQHIVGQFLNALGDRPAVKGFTGDCFENQEVERSLQKIGWLGHVGRPSYLERRQSSTAGPLLPTKQLQRQAEAYDEPAGENRQLGGELGQAEAL